MDANQILMKESDRESSHAPSSPELSEFPRQSQIHSVLCLASVCLCLFVPGSRVEFEIGLKPSM